MICKTREEIITIDRAMDRLDKKRKGIEKSGACEKDFERQGRLGIVWPRLSLDIYLRRKKKCKEVMVSKVANSRNFNGVATAPARGTVCSEYPGRGLKRKIGCIDVATRLGRKKKIDHDYELVKPIGHGKFGSVVLCQNKATGEEFACKTLRKGEEIVHREVEIMQHLSGHPGVVTLKAVYEDAESFHLVMELCSGGRLLDQMVREGLYSEWKAANIIKELMLAIRYCHKMGVVHRDIKPENILLSTSGQMKLADFGLAVRILDGQSLSGVAGSPAYVAPEVLFGVYSEKVDIWSAGVLLHALLVGVLPFQGSSLETLFEAIKKKQLDFTYGIWESVSLPARDLLANMLTRSVSKRLTADEVLRHPWISFYSDLSLHTLAPKLENHLQLNAVQLSCFLGLESEKRRLTSCISLSDNSCPSLASVCSTDILDGEDDGLVDILAVAISHIRISEPKRSRFCSPLQPIQQECSSNLKNSLLCTAF